MWLLTLAMPKKVIPMETLLAAALAGELGSINVAAFCRERKLSRQTFYKYKARFAQEGLVGLEARSRAPKTSPGRTPVELEDLIVALHKELADNDMENGPGAIQFLLGRRHKGEFKIPAEATIWRIMDRRGFVTKTPSKRPKSSWRRFEASLPNELWQTDHTDWVTAQRGVQILSFLDDHSRLAGRCRVWDTVTTENVKVTFNEATAIWGVPSGQLSDNGLCFSGKLRGIEVAFEAHLRELGVRAITSRPFHPQTCGKVERFQQTMKKWLRKRQQRLGRLAHDNTELQAWIDEFVHYYNHERPHRGIGRITPIERWQATPPAVTSNDARPAPPITLAINDRGVMQYRGWRIMLGVTHRNQRAHVLIDGTQADIYVNGGLITRIHLDPERTYIANQPPRDLT